MAGIPHVLHEPFVAIQGKIALHIREEDVLPALTPHGPRFQLLHVHSLLGQAGEHPGQGPGPIGQGEQEGGLVPVARRGHLGSNDQEAGPVLRQILDASLQHVETETLGQCRVGDGRFPAPMLHPLRRRCRALRWHHLGLRKLGAQPGGALLQGLGMGMDHPDLGQALARGEQAVGDLAEDLRLNEDLKAQEEVQALAHGSLQGVLQGNDPQIRLALPHAAEDVLQHGRGPVLRGSAQVVQPREVGEGSLRAQIDHTLAPLQAPGGGEDLPVHRPEVLLGHGTGVVLQDLGDHLLFPKGLEHRVPAVRLEAADLPAQGGASVQMRHQLLVHAGDLLPQPEQLAGPVPG